MALSNMVVFNENLREATGEALAQNVDAFNARSNGGIVLSSMNFEGDFFEHSFYSALYSSRRRVDRYAAQAPVASDPLAEARNDGVKVAGGFGPIAFEPAQMTWINSNESEAITVISQQLADAIVQDQLNTAVASAVAAIDNAGYTETGTLGYPLINQSHAIFGDHSRDLVVEVMTGAAFHALIGDNLANAERLYQSDGVLIVDILGKPVVVSDIPALAGAGSPPSQTVLSLSSGGIIVYDGSDVVTNIETNNGQSRIETTMQADYSFGLRLKGYTWDQTNGGRSPDDTDLTTGTNWDQTVTSVKHTAGVLAVGS